MNQKSNEKFNELIEYIEDNLCESISYKKLSQLLGVNEYSMHRIFLFVTSYTLGEYIRKRRLSMSALDLLEGNERIIDIAVKYKYESSQAFSRAFKSMMGFTPSEISDNKNDIKFFPKYELTDEDVEDEFHYHIEKNVKFDLYGISMNTTVNDCYKEAPQFWKDNLSKIDGKNEYGLVEYDKSCLTNDLKYYIASDEEFENSKPIHLKASDYLVFEYEHKSSEYNHKCSSKIYRVIIPSLGYELENLPDIEEYLEDNKMKLYIPIKSK